MLEILERGGDGSRIYRACGDVALNTSQRCLYFPVEIRVSSSNPIFDCRPACLDCFALSAQSCDVVPSCRIEGCLDMLLERPHVVTTLCSQRSGNEQNQGDGEDKEFAHGPKSLLLQNVYNEMRMRMSFKLSLSSK